MRLPATAAESGQRLHARVSSKSLPDQGWQRIAPLFTSAGCAILPGVYLISLSHRNPASSEFRPMSLHLSTTARLFPWMHGATECDLVASDKSSHDRCRCGTEILTVERGQRRVVVVDLDVTQHSAQRHH